MVESENIKPTAPITDRNIKWFDKIRVINQNSAGEYMRKIGCSCWFQRYGKKLNSESFYAAT